MNLFSKRCNHLDLITLPVSDRFGKLLFNIHHYHYFQDGLRYEEVVAEREDNLLSVCLFD